jgi:hypothetical protein
LIQINREDYTEFFFADKLASQSQDRSSLTGSNINLVIANHEGFDTPYRMDVLSGDQLVYQFGTIIVPSGEKRLLAFNLPNSLDSSKPVYFYLYNLSNDSSSLPYRKLSMWLK